MGIHPATPRLLQAPHAITSESLLSIRPGWAVRQRHVAGAGQGEASIWAVHSSKTMRSGTLARCPELHRARGCSRSNPEVGDSCHPLLGIAWQSRSW